MTTTSADAAEEPKQIIAPTDTKKGAEIVQDDQELREKVSALSEMLLSMETGMDGISDEDIVPINNCLKALNEKENKYNRDTWWLIMLTVNKAITDLCSKGRARHSLPQRMRRIQLVNEIGAIINA